MQIEIHCEDRMGIAKEVLDVMQRHAVDVREMEISSPGRIYLALPTMSFAQLQQLMPAIRRIAGVVDVKTTAYLPKELDRLQLATLFDVLPDAAVVSNEKGIIIRVNAAAEQLFGRAASLLHGLPVQQLIDGVKLDSHNQHFAIKIAQLDYTATVLSLQQHQNNGAIGLGNILLLRPACSVTQTTFNPRAWLTNEFTDVGSSCSQVRVLLSQLQQLASSGAPLVLLGAQGSGVSTIAEQALRFCPQYDQGVVRIDGADSECVAQLAQQCSEGVVFIEDLHLLSASQQRACYQWLNEHPQLQVFATATAVIQLMVSQGEFHSRLWSQIAKAQLLVPSLLQRSEDILPLAESFIRQLSAQSAINPPKLDEEACEMLQGYHWPGNISQLRDVMAQALLTCQGGQIRAQDLAINRQQLADHPLFDQLLEGTLEQSCKMVERAILQRLYPKYPSSRQLAKRLGISHTAIANKLREHGISKLKRS